MSVTLAQKDEPLVESAAPGTGLDALILDFRNKALANRIAEESHDRIFITYGSQHLPGLIELLQQQDPAWKIASVKWMRTIEMPKHFEGNLSGL